MSEIAQGRQLFEEMKNDHSDKAQQMDAAFHQAIQNYGASGNDVKDPKAQDEMMRLIGRVIDNSDSIVARGMFAKYGYASQEGFDSTIVDATNKALAGQNLPTAPTMHEQAQEHDQQAASR